MNNLLQNLNLDLKDKDILIQHILNLSTDGLIILNINNEIINLNKAAKLMLNDESDELVGKKLENFIFDIASNENKNIESMITDGDTNSFNEIRVMSNKNTFYPVELAISKIQLSEDVWAICTIRNIFARKQAELFLSISRELTNIERVEIAMPKILRVICETMSLEIGGLWMIDGFVLKCVALFSHHAENKDIADFICKSKEYSFESGVGLPGRVWKSKSANWIKDVVSDANFPRAPYALKADLHAAFAFPVMFNEEVVGVLEFFMHQAYQFNDQWMQMLNDTSDQIGIFLERERAWRQLMEMQRQAGMVEIAASVLHNIGNVLNSAGVSISSLNEEINTSAFVNASKVLGFLKENATHLQDYLSQDARGKLLPEYFIQLLAELELAREVLKKESKNISTHFNHINEIVNSQSAISGCKSGVIEKIFLPDIIDVALQLSAHTLASKNIRLDKVINSTLFVTVDKSRLVQIIVNFIQNAKDSLMCVNDDKLKIISIEVAENNVQDCADIIVKDNGMGISAENLHKLFKFGFTTKPKGHGFGLYNSFLSAKDLGGTILVESEGEGSGATFILRLPIAANDKKLDGEIYE